MREYNKPIGNYGEDLTSSYIKSKGYAILDRNFKKKNGEIDIIAYKNDIVVFIEVKTRLFNKSFSIFESITKSKICTIKKIASYYIYTHNLFNKYIRYDACYIELNKYDNTYKLNYIEDAFR